MIKFKVKVMLAINEMTQKEVADRLGISQSYISRLEKRILSDLKLAIAGKI